MFNNNLLSVMFANAPRAKYIIHIKKIIPITFNKLKFIFFFYKFNNLMRYIFLLFLLLSCSSKSSFKLEGDWKLKKLFREGEEVICKTASGDDCPKIITSYRSDNLLFYYGNLLTYQKTDDSLFYYNEQTGKIQNAFKFDKIDDNNYSLIFIRRLKIDSVNIKELIYKSLWTKEL